MRRRLGGLGSATAFPSAIADEDTADGSLNTRSVRASCWSPRLFKDVELAQSRPHPRGHAQYRRRGCHPHPNHSTRPTARCVCSWHSRPDRHACVWGRRWGVERFPLFSGYGERSKVWCILASTSATLWWPWDSSRERVMGIERVRGPLQGQRSRRTGVCRWRSGYGRRCWDPFGSRARVAWHGGYLMPEELSWRCWRRCPSFSPRFTWPCRDCTPGGRPSVLIHAAAGGVGQRP